MRLIQKDYEQPFLLEPTKLTRIIGKIHERLTDYPDTTLHDNFEVFISGNRREEMTTLDEVLALDNSKKRKIERLVMACSVITPGAVRPAHEVQVDFAFPKPSKTSPGNTTMVVAIAVRSDAAAWASRTLAEVEEQVERTWLRNTWPTASLVVLLICLLVVLILVVASPFVSFRYVPMSTQWWLTSADAGRIEAMLKEGPILTDEQLREISTMQLRNYLGLPGSQHTIQRDEIRRMLFIAVPLGVVLTCVLVLLITCYPTTVFYWGDEVQHYTNILQRRQRLWNFIVGVIVVGTLSNLIFEGFMSGPPRRS